MHWWIRKCSVQYVNKYQEKKIVSNEKINLPNEGKLDLLIR